MSSGLPFVAPIYAVRTPVTVTRPESQITPSHSEDTGGSGYIVIVYDNSRNTYEQVIHILQVATACTYQEAYIEAWEVDHLGKSVVHHGGKEECERVAGIIRQIGITVEVTDD